MNPIYIQYYSHEEADCYKINLPWTEYREERVVLCRVDEGFDKAKELAKEVIAKSLEKKLTLKVKEKQDK